MNNIEKIDKEIDELRDQIIYAVQGSINNFKKEMQKKQLKRWKAEEYRRYLDIKSQIMDIAEELNGNEVIVWSNSDQTKFCIKIKKNELVQDCDYSCKGKDIYCLSDKFLQTCIDKIGEDDLEFYFKSEFI